MSFQVGETIHLGEVITNVAGQAVDPAFVKISIRQSNGVIIVDSATVSKVEVGLYNYDYIPTMIGTHRYNIVATGGDGKKSIVKSSFFVEVAL